MQRRNCVALFAALAIGFGAVQAQAAASVESVTVEVQIGTKKALVDSGQQVGIDQKLLVTAEVQDFSPNNLDAVIFYLAVGSDTTQVVHREASEDAVNISHGGPTATPNQDQIDDAELSQVLVTALGRIDRGGEPDFSSLTSVDEVEGTADVLPVGAVPFMVAHTNRVAAEKAAAMLTAKKPAEAATHSGHGNYIRVAGAGKEADRERDYPLYLGSPHPLFEL